MSDVARTPKAPCRAVIFTSTRTAEESGYEQTAAAMVALGSRPPGFPGIEGARVT